MSFVKGDRVIVVRYNSPISDEGKANVIGQPGTVTKSVVAAGIELVYATMDNEIVGLRDWAFYSNELEALL